MGAQWLSGRVLDSKTRPCLTERLLMGQNESINQTNKINVRSLLLSVSVCEAGGGVFVFEKYVYACLHEYKNKKLTSKIADKNV